jgi:hypothetical protein
MICAYKIGDCVQPRPEWKSDPNRIPTGTVRRIEPWGSSKGGLYVGAEQRAFASYAFELESEREDLQMARALRLDDQGRAALRKLDDTFSINGEVATVSGPMEVEVTRLASDGGDQFQLRFIFPSNETLDVKIRRVQLLEQLDVEADES